MMKAIQGKFIVGVIVGLGLMFVGTSLAHASLKEMKLYKEAFPDSKPKCVNCHIDEKPKKDDGQHEANDYGKAVMKAAGSEPATADTYKAIGKIEDFKQ